MEAQTRVLHLPLKGEYFDQIKAGTKPEEFRLCNDYWRKRLEGQQYDTIVLTRGYPSRDDTERRLKLPWRGYQVRSITHPHFGPESVEVFAIQVAEPTPQVAVLFARGDSCYKQLEGTDVWDIERDARRWPGGCPVVAHPQCRAWGRLRRLANPRPDEKELALFAVDQVRQFGGVLEHPAGSTLWEAKGLPAPGTRDAWGGWTLPINQNQWGHRAEKATWLYIVGVEPANLPPIPLVLGEATHIVCSSGRRRDGSRLRKGDAGWRPEITKAEREHTPVALAEWLCEVARAARGGLHALPRR